MSNVRQVYTEKLLTFKEAAERLGVSFWFLYRRRDELPLVRLGPRTVRLKESDVRAWQDAHVIAARIIEKTKDARAERDAKRKASGAFLMPEDLEPPATTE